ncbi:MAG TPA: FGGY-family carbohydrate kinase [Spirochaetia bacterium]|nr:FGGY-family carbohydrate kinase [Spirochaetia bacterium]
MGIDIGTYSSKGVLVTEEGRIVASSSAEHELSMPRPGWAEHDPESVWWAELRSIVKTLLGSAAGVPRRISAIAVSTISPAVVAVGDDGRALRPAILYGIDTRASREIQELSSAYRLELDTQSAAPKVLWIRRNEPEVWARTRRIVNGSGYLTLRLTGEATLDVYDATIFEPLFDTDRLAWSEEASRTIAPVEMMPRVTWTAETAGQVTEEAARETGLAAGTPVITGTADAAAESVSAGLSRPGDMMVMYGSSTFFILKTESLFTPKGFWGTRFLEEGSYVVAGGTATAGSLTRWFRDNLAPAQMDYAALAELAGRAPAGSNGLVALPYFSGERTPLQDPEARGMIFGLTLRHTRGDVYRALLESVGYSIRHNIEALEAQGCQPQRILAVGGGTRNPLWMQIVSDIAGITQEVPAEQMGASYGDAFLAGIGGGVFSGTKDVGRWVRPGVTYTPDAGAHAAFAGPYAIYRDLYEATASSMHALGKITRP